MHLEETPEQLALRTELRAYFADLLTDEARKALDSETEGGAMHRTLVRQMGQDGWLGIGWPKEFGGQGRPVSDQFIFFNEVQRARAPFPFVTLNTVGPMLMRYGTEEQKSYFLSGILGGEINFAIGYTEPSAGTDLASLRTRAVRDGDEWVINGNKVYTSGADQADFIWLAARTDPDAPKHKGISIFLVPTSDPGFSCTPIVTVGNVVTTASYYDNVRVPTTALVGGLNEGWRLITGQLNHERVGLGAMYALPTRLWAETAQWAIDEGVADVDWVQADLGRTYALLEAQKLLNWRMVAAVADVVAAFPSEWARFCGGDEGIGGFLIGKVMGATQGKADGKAVRAELARLRG